MALTFAVAVSCGGHGESPTAPPMPTLKTIARLSVDPATCSTLTLYPVRGNLSATSFTYKTGDISLLLNQPAVDIELPQGGAYRALFWYGSSIFNQTRAWDQTINVPANATTQFVLNCR